MALLVAFSDAKKNQFRREALANDGRKAGALRIPFFGSRDDPNSPFATLNQHDAGRFSSTHFHRVDQFQVIVGGKGKIGRHHVGPYSVHFTRTYTPYGPVLSEAGFTFFVLRARSDSGSLHLPEDRHELDLVSDRQPWQLTRRAMLPTLPSATGTPDIIVRPVPGMEDRQGLAVYTLSMLPDAQTVAPDPSDGNGQYLVVTRGSLLHERKEYSALSLVFIGHKEKPFPVHAGATGLEGLVLTFPRGHAPVAMNAPATAGFATWRCALCGYAYDEAAGLPEEGILPHTVWKDVPQAWSCPDCNASKADFQKVEVQN